MSHYTYNSLQLLKFSLCNKFSKITLNFTGVLFQAFFLQIIQLIFSFVFHENHSFTKHQSLIILVAFNSELVVLLQIAYQLLRRVNLIIFYHKLIHLFEVLIASSYRVPCCSYFDGL